MWPILRLRTIAYSCLLVASVVELVVSSSVLAWSLQVYRGGYIKSNPQLVGCSAVTIFLFAFVFMEKTKRRIKLWMECLAVGIMFTLWTISLARLYIATPGLLSSCGGFLVCKGWIAMLCFAWMAVGSLAAVFMFVFVGASVLHFKRGDHSAFKTYAGDVNWQRRDWLNRLSLKHVELERTPPLPQHKEMEERQFTLE